MRPRGACGLSSVLPSLLRRPKRSWAHCTHDPRRQRGADSRRCRALPGGGGGRPGRTRSAARGSTPRFARASVSGAQPGDDGSPGAPCSRPHRSRGAQWPRRFPVLRRVCWPSAPRQDRDEAAGQELASAGLGQSSEEGAIIEPRLKCLGSPAWRKRLPQRRANGRSWWILASSPSWPTAWSGPQSGANAEGRCLVLGDGEATRGLVALDLLGFFYSDIGAPPPAARA